MSEDFVFGDIIAYENQSVPNNNITTYELIAPYYNGKLQKGEFFISTSNNLYQVTPVSSPRKIGNINLSVAIDYGQYITAIASFIPEGPTGSINSQIIISKPVVIKAKVKPQTIQDDLIPVIQPAMVSQAQSPSPQLINFNVGTGGVVLVSSAFAVLLIMLYRQWSANKIKGDKV